MLVEDVAVTPSDIQDLATPDAVAALFAKLGYDTNARLVQNASAMGITNEDLRASIRRIERLSDDDDGISSLQAYLFELKSVTVAATRGIVRAFRDRAGDYLLVMTDDFQRLDFVLVDRYTQAEIGVEQAALPGMPAMPAMRQVRVQPRVLSIDRRKPSPVAVRTIRRFSYTESDTLAQFEKLRAAYDIAYWSEPHFNNRALFSDYYLTERLPSSAEWTSAAEKAEQVRAFRALRELYTIHERPADPAEPVLAILGFSAARVRQRGSDTTEPDFRLSPAGAGSEGQVRPLALCLAYPWGRNLDGKDEERDPERGNANPGAVVVKLLDSGEAGWAIVTNGRIWRLYSATAHSRASNYYEIDLQDLLSQPASTQAEAFPYFWLLFRAAAFVPVLRLEAGEEREASFLDTLLAESERYARDLEEKLKTRVFEEVFPHFAGGFIAYARRHGKLPANLERLPDEERNRALTPYFAGTLTFFYRLLFVLYAESRDLLPIREARGYAEHSLDRLKREIADRAGTVGDAVASDKIRRAYVEDSTVLYDRMQVLFQAIDKGNAELNVPVYNGGLFAGEPEEADTSAEAEVARFLTTLKIPDRQLALGIDRLARDVDEKTQALGFIDYKSLGVRQLGSMYEGLLEFKLRVTPERMAIVRGKKAEEIVPYAEAVSKGIKPLTTGTGKDRQERTIAAGELYLENDKRERKASGSYYTPDYIVKYIVEHTVGPVLAEKLEALRPAFRQAQQTLQAERQKRDALLKQRMPVKNPEEEAYLKTRGAVNEAFFDVKVLDPAMGSGHFLVEAVDYVTDRMADFLTAFPWNPVVHELAKTRNEITEEMERQGVTVNAARLTDLNLLKRHVLKRCIYGVDLNPMAVELAKVSLWLDCFTLGAPLSFLDHHMKIGNSLIGASVEEVEKSLNRNLWGSQFAGLLSATQMMREVGDLSDVTAQEVAASKRAYRGARDALAPFKRLLDVWLSDYFGNRGAQKTVDTYAQAIVDDNYASANEVDRKAIRTALALAEEKHFFHWELEFPEVFYEAHERKVNGGFGAVVGNPPYLIIGNYEQYEPYFDAAYETAGYKADYFMLFVERGLSLISATGLYSQIFPNKFTLTKSGQGLREVFSRYRVLSIIDFGTSQVFEGAINYVMIPVVTNRRAENPHPGTVSYRLTTAGFSRTLKEINMPENSLSPNGWQFVADDESHITERLETLSSSLSDTAQDIFAGIQTGADDILVVPSSTVAARRFERSLLKRFIKGRHIRRYDLSWDDGWLIYPYGPDGRILSEGVLASKFPNIWRYLQENRTALSERLWFGKTPLDVSGTWYGLMYLPDSNLFDAPKIVCPYLAQRATFAFDTDSSLFGVGAGYGIFLKPAPPLTPLYVLALLCSQVAAYRFAQISPRFQAGYKHNEVYISQLPIRRISFTSPATNRTRHFEEARRLYEGYLTAGDDGNVLAFVAAQLSHDPEQSDVVHDLLAFLAEEMIRLNKEKRAEQKRYLDGLVAALRVLPDRDGNAGLDALSGKSKLADYPGDYQKGEAHLPFDELLDTLRKNKARLSVSLSDPALLERLRHEYEATLTRVLPLKERLARTDRLIDQIVYQLYGLTKDEIAIVEGR